MFSNNGQLTSVSWKFKQHIKAYLSIFLNRIIVLGPKGQLILKADWGAIDSPKKRMDDFVLFPFLLFTANKQIRPFIFWENLQLTNLLFKIYWPLAFLVLKVLAWGICNFKLEFAQKSHLQKQITITFYVWFEVLWKRQYSLRVTKLRLGRFSQHIWHKVFITNKSTCSFDTCNCVIKNGHHFRNKVF